MEAICRICWSDHDELVNIFDEMPGPGPSIPDMIAQWSKYPVFKGDFFPEHICPTCLEDVKTKYKVPMTLNSPRIEPADFDDTEESNYHAQEQTYCSSLQTKDALGDHIDSDSNDKKDTCVKQHKCNDCLKAFRFKNQLTMHIRTHTGEQPYQCPLCYCAFKQKHHLLRQMIVHTRKDHTNALYAKGPLRDNLFSKLKIEFTTDLCVENGIQTCPPISHNTP